MTKASRAWDEAHRRTGLPRMRTDRTVKGFDLREPCVAYAIDEHGRRIGAVLSAQNGTVMIMPADAPAASVALTGPALFEGRLQIDRVISEMPPGLPMRVVK